MRSPPSLARSRSRSRSLQRSDSLSPSSSLSFPPLHFSAGQGGVGTGPPGLGASPGRPTYRGRQSRATASPQPTKARALRSAPCASDDRFCQARGAAGLTSLLHGKWSRRTARCVRAHAARARRPAIGIQSIQRAALEEARHQRSGGCGYQEIPERAGCRTSLLACSLPQQQGVRIPQTPNRILLTAPGDHAYQPACSCKCWNRLHGSATHKCMVKMLTKQWHVACVGGSQNLYGN